MIAIFVRFAVSTTISSVLREKMRPRNGEESDSTCLMAHVLDLGERDS